MTDNSSLREIVNKIEPDEVYNLAAQSHIQVSFDQSEYTTDVIATGTLRLLNAIRDVIKNTGKSVRFYQACSSEMFGNAPSPQNENTRFSPRNPYAVSKATAAVYVPVIASGGAGSYQHLAEVLKDGSTGAVAAASIFHSTEQIPREAKLYLKEQGFPMRLEYISRSLTSIDQSPSSVI